MIRIALVVTYLIGLVFGVVALDASGNDGWTAALWVVGSVLLGAGMGDYRFTPLALLAVPIAIPFGLPVDRTGDPVLPVWFGAMYLALLSAALIMLSVFVRQFVESHLRRRRASRTVDQSS